MDEAEQSVEELKAEALYWKNVAHHLMYAFFHWQSLYRLMHRRAQKAEAIKGEITMSACDYRHMLWRRDFYYGLYDKLRDDHQRLRCRYNDALDEIKALKTPKSTGFLGVLRRHWEASERTK